MTASSARCADYPLKHRSLLQRSVSMLSFLPLLAGSRCIACTHTPCKHACVEDVVMQLTEGHYMYNTSLHALWASLHALRRLGCAQVDDIADEVQQQLRAVASGQARMPLELIATYRSLSITCIIPVKKSDPGPLCSPPPVILPLQTCMKAGHEIRDQRSITSNP